MHEKHKFGILINIPYLMENSLNPKDISKSFSALSNNDLCTSAAYILSRKEVR
jgi:hypothetical protein